jgi:SAM-dependent methyltransferase
VSLDDARAGNRRVWASGDWDAVADVIAAVGPRVLDRIELAPGARLLDIGSGTGGSIAIPAAQRGADVLASDVTDTWFDVGRARVAAAGVDVEWAVADAMDLPFDDASFDVVTSTFGHMFAPDHAAAAREVARVVKPGGTVALATWTPEGFVGSFFATVAAHAPPPPPGAEPAILWGEEERVRGLLEPHGLELTFERAICTFDGADPTSFVDLYGEAFGPVVTARAAIGDERWPALRAELIDLFERENTKTDGSVSVDAEYLLILGKRAF